MELRRDGLLHAKAQGEARTKQKTGQRRHEPLEPGRLSFLTGSGGSSQGKGTLGEEDDGTRCGRN